MKFEKDDESGLLLPKRRSFLFLGLSALAGAFLPKPPVTQYRFDLIEPVQGFGRRIVELDDELIYIVQQASPLTTLVRRGYDFPFNAPIIGTAYPSEAAELPSGRSILGQRPDGRVR